MARRHPGTQPNPANPKSWLTGASETIVLLMVFLVPLAIWPGTANANAIKDLLFGLGSIALAVLLTVRLMRGERLRLGRSPLFLPLACMLAWDVVSGLLSGYLYASLTALGHLAGYALLYIAVVDLAAERGQLGRLLAVVMSASLLTCVYGLLQHWGIDWIEWYPRELRLLSSFGNPTFFAAWLVLLLPLAVVLHVQAETRAGRLAAGTLALLMYVCLLFTYTRAAWLGLALGLVVTGLLLSLKRATTEETGKAWYLRIGWLAFAFAVATLWTLGHSPVSMSSRLASSFQTNEASNVQRLGIWHGALAMFKAHPVTGAGLGTFEIHFPEFESPEFYSTGAATMVDHAHNEFLETAAETGLIGLGLLLWLAVACVVTAVRAARLAEARWRYLASGALGGLVAFMVQNLAGVTLRWVFGGLFFWLLLALVTVAEQQSRSNRSEAPGTSVITARGNAWPASRLAAASVVIALAAVLGSVAVVRAFAAGYHLKQGRLASQQSVWELAGTQLTEALRLDPYSLDAYYQLGHVLNMTGDYEGALSAYQSLGRLAPNYGRLHFNLGVVYSNLGDTAQAVAEYRRAVALEDSPSAHLALAEGLMAEGQGEEALEEAGLAIAKLDKQGPAPALILGTPICAGASSDLPRSNTRELNRTTASVWS